MIKEINIQIISIIISYLIYFKFHLCMTCDYDLEDDFVNSLLT